MKYCQNGARLPSIRWQVSAIGEILTRRRRDSSTARQCRIRNVRADPLPALLRRNGYWCEDDRSHWRTSRARRTREDFAAQGAIAVLKTSTLSAKALDRLIRSRARENFNSYRRILISKQPCFPNSFAGQAGAGRDKLNIQIASR